ncbi:MAG: ATP-binding protein [Bacteroidota bacterium]
MAQTSDLRHLADQLIAENATTLQLELAWFSIVVDNRIRHYLGLARDYENPDQIPAPNLDGDPAIYAQVVQRYQLDRQDRLILLLALVPHLAPQLLDPFFLQNPEYNRPYSEFGGTPHNSKGAFQPTVETALFLLAGDHLEQRMQARTRFAPGEILQTSRLIELHAERPGAALNDHQLRLGEEFCSWLTEARPFRPRFSANFPATPLRTGLAWDELILPPETRAQVDEILGWMRFGKEIMEEWGMGRKFSPGYRSLFYGPPGTGKTLTATLLGKVTGREVYRIDLSQVVSKYIGETEKNLSTIFAKAEHRDWILFFDEADALFGKRTATQSAHDRHANQEVSYLLQRVENFDGLVILATNQKNNLDKAFHRRFQSMVEFPMPGQRARQRLWENSFPEACKLEEDLKVEELAGEYQISGGAIMNVVRYACLKAKMREENMIRKADVTVGIQREMRKAGKTV